MDIEYRFSATANDGKLWQRKDWVSGKEVTYQYDQLGRLIAAAATGPEWGQSYTYDGFGNLTQQAVTKGTAPSMSMMVDPATNRLAGAGITYTGGGNLKSDGVHSFTYDRKNRVKTVAGETYAYSWKNERVLVTRASGAREIHFYGAGGEKLGVYAAEYDAAQGVYVAVRQSAQERVYFGGRLLYLGGEKVISDRLGSVVRHSTTSYRYYPYGQEIGGATTNDKPKFGTYTRDASTGLDYAMNRYYKNEWGRFTTPDPAQPANVEEPQSWNFYTYVLGDPVNLNDPDGLAPCGDATFMPLGRSVKDIMLKYDNLSYLSMVAWHEAGPVYTSDLTNMDAFAREQGLIVSALLNRWDIANGRLTVYGIRGEINISFGGGATDLTSIIMEAAGNNRPWGIFSNGRLRTTVIAGSKDNLSPQARLEVALRSDDSSRACYAVLSAIAHAHMLLNELPGFRYGFVSEATVSPTIVLFWNQAPAALPGRSWSPLSVPSGLPETIANLGKVRANGNTWFGYSALPPPTNRNQREVR